MATFTTVTGECIGRLEIELLIHSKAAVFTMDMADERYLSIIELTNANCLSNSAWLGTIVMFSAKTRSFHCCKVTKN